MSEKKKGVFGKLVELNKQYDKTAGKIDKLAAEWSEPPKPQGRRTLRQYTSDLTKKSLVEAAALANPKKIGREDFRLFTGFGTLFRLLFAGLLWIVVGIGSLFTIFKRKRQNEPLAGSAETSASEEAVPASTAEPGANDPPPSED